MAKFFLDHIERVLLLPFGAGTRRV